MKMLISRLNSRAEESVAGLVDECDAAYYGRIEKIAEDITQNVGKKSIILVSGPSGSGKTTSAMMIEKILDSRGCETHTLSMDNYFLPLTPEQKQLADADKFDLESPTRIDIDFLNGQLEKIAAGEPVEIPKFDFANNRRVSSGWTLERKPNELVILEGIHSLNPSVITMPDDQTTRIYVSVRTRLCLEDGTELHPEKIRLMRRMLRDKIYRNRELSHTLKMFDSVQRGENKYIMPYKHRSTYDIDTFIPYEINVYKTMLFDGLKQLEPTGKVADMLAALDETEPVPASCVPVTSLIREFIGDGQFNY